jgi:hypothetical protein
MAKRIELTDRKAIADRRAVRRTLRSEISIPSRLTAREAERFRA